MLELANQKCVAA